MLEVLHYKVKCAGKKDIVIGSGVRLPSAIFSYNILFNYNNIVRMRNYSDKKCMWLDMVFWIEKQCASNKISLVDDAYINCF